MTNPPRLLLLTTELQSRERAALDIAVITLVGIERGVMPEYPGIALMIRRELNRIAGLVPDAVKP